MSNRNSRALAVVGTIVMSLAVGFLYLAYIGWILMTIWNWFLVEIGIDEINILPAIGISLIVSLLTIKQLDKSTKPNMENVSVSLVTPLAILLYAWIFHLFL